MSGQLVLSRHAERAYRQSGSQSVRSLNCTLCNLHGQLEPHEKWQKTLTIPRRTAPYDRICITSHYFFIVSAEEMLAVQKLRNDSANDRSGKQIFCEVILAVSNMALPLVRPHISARTYDGITGNYTRKLLQPLNHEPHARVERL